MSVLDDIEDYVKKYGCWIADLLNAPEIGDGSICQRRRMPSQPQQTAPGTQSGPPIVPPYANSEPRTSPKKQDNRPNLSRKRTPAPDRIPQRKFPSDSDGQTRDSNNFRESDGQSDIKTPAGSSISLKEALVEREYGRLLWIPVLNEKVDITYVDATESQDTLNQLLSEGFDKFKAWITNQSDQEITLWDKSAMVFPESPSGGNPRFLYGNEGLRFLTFINKQSSMTADYPVHDFVAREVNWVRRDTTSDFFRMPIFGKAVRGVRDVVDIVSLKNLDDVLGLDKFPGNLPPIFNVGRDELENNKSKDEKILEWDSGTKSYKIHSYVDLALYFVQELDALIGEFPVQIQIDDASLTEEGDQKKEIAIGNIAEALTEIYGLLTTNSLQTDVSLNILTRMIIELTRIRQIGLTTQDIVYANREFLGYREKSISREVESPFTINNDLDDYSAMLKESTQKYVSMEFAGKETVLEYLIRLFYAAGLLKASLLAKVEDVKKVMETATNDLESNDDWESFEDEINNPSSFFNKGENPSRVRGSEEDN